MGHQYHRLFPVFLHQLHQRFPRRNSWVWDKGMLQGKSELHAHYFENGNIQFQCVMDFDAVPVSRSNLMKQIEEWEEKIHQRIRELYDDISCDIKSMRRILPISKRKMDWDLHL